MISILLTLLKIIGIVLLSLLGLLLILVLTVLFVPVRYRIKGYYKEEFVCYVKATWLLHLFSLTLDFDKELVTSFRILGMDVSSFFNSKGEKASKSKKGKLKATTQQEEIPAQAQKQVPEESHTTQSQTEPFVHVEEDNISFSESDNITTNIRNKVLSLFQKICKITDKVKQIIANILKAKESIERYIQILQREEVKGAFMLCKKRFIKMIKHLLPKKMKIHAHIGMEDPAVTGYILAAYSVLPDKFHRQIILQTEFDKVIMEGDFTIKGSCNAISFIHEILCIVTDKNCRTFYKLVKKEISNERK